jgi:putative restriction endonuclease
MRYWLGITDSDWYRYLAERPSVDEVNFWQPSARRQAVILPVGAPFLFKLHAGDGGWVVGGGTFVRYSKLSPRFAWDAFGDLNGAPTLDVMVRRVERYRRGTVDVDADEIGAFVIVQPYFLPREHWVQPPLDWAPNIVQGRTYDTETRVGAALWASVEHARIIAAPAAAAEAVPTYGDPVPVRPRLGQGAFRVLVTDAYGRRCAVTGERTLPVLEAAHIKPYSLSGPHDLENGLLLRSDLHTLFDRGYVTVAPDRTFLVSRRIREDYENGRDYYALEGKRVSMPAAPNPPPSSHFLEWHANTVFRG